MTILPRYCLISKQFHFQNLAHENSTVVGATRDGMVKKGVGNGAAIFAVDLMFCMGFHVVSKDWAQAITVGVATVLLFLNLAFCRVLQQL